MAHVSPLDSSKTLWIFTDGACSGNPGPGGWACLLGSGEKVSLLSGFEESTTNNRMELLAAIEALNHLSSSYDLSSMDEVHLFTDSSYVSKGIMEWIHGWKKKNWIKSDGQEVANVDLWKNLDVAYSKIKLSNTNLKWQLVPGHAGVPGNEYVDQAAVQSYLEKTSSSQDWLMQTFPQKEIFVDFPVLRSKEASKTNKSFSKGVSGSNSFYVSIVKGEIKRHSTWSECEARVKGVPGARFKKLKNEAELEAWLRK